MKEGKNLFFLNHQEPQPSTARPHRRQQQQTESKRLE